LNDTNKNYKSARIRIETYKELKLLALELDMPLTQVIEMLYNEYRKHGSKPKADSD
jgi:hypothetical protein